MIRTFNTTILVNDSEDAQLQAYAKLFAKVEHTLHAAMERATARGASQKGSSFKVSYCAKFGITARQFNSVQKSLDGKRDAIAALNKNAVVELQCKLNNLKRSYSRVVAELASSIKNTSRQSKLLSRKIKLLHKTERLTSRLLRLKKDVAEGRIRLCFGSKRLFNSQHYLAPNQYSDHSSWLQDWRETRENQFCCIGSKDETAGNQSCTAILTPNGLSLRLRLPNALVKGSSKHLVLPPVRFPYGQEAMEKALALGQALTYRFMRIAPSKWRIAFTTEVHSSMEHTSYPILGRLGVDLNSGFLMVTETDRFGNKILTRRLNTPERGLTISQREALRGEAVKSLIQWALRTRKPIVLEDLDLTKSRKKASSNVEAKRKISSLAYSALRQQIESRAFDHGITVEIVNPAYSSVQGQLKAVRHGLSVHGGASLVLARRSQGYSENLPKSASLCRLAVRGGVIQWQAPVRMSAGEETAAWRGIGAAIQQVLKAHYRSLWKKRPSMGTAVISGESPALNWDLVPSI